MCNKQNYLKDNPIVYIMKPLRIYVAGPITADDPDVVSKNEETAKKVGEELLKLGHFPYVPHVHFADWNVDRPKFRETFLKHGEDIIERWADALFFIAPSNGANREKAKAESLGLQIFTSLEEVKKIKLF